MAISVTTATIPFPNLNRSAAFCSSKLCASTSLQFPPQIRYSLPENQRIFSLPQRRILPRVQATKQSFSSFADLLENSEKPVLVDFYAIWCGPCQIMGPILDKVGAALKDEIQVVKIDTEKYPKIANEYKIEALPTFIIFKDGKPCDRFEGALPADKLTERIKGVLKKVEQ